jgi:hypothetical protein
VPTTYSTDPQTGANITNVGYFVNAENLTFTIQNQPNVTYYTIRWTTRYMSRWNNIDGDNSDGFGMNATIASSSGSTTTWVITSTGGYSFAVSGNFNLNFESGATIEFQVQACDGSPQFYAGLGIGEGYFIIGGASNWSNNQTITIPANTPSSATPIPTSSPASTSTSTLTPTPTQTPTTVSSALNSSLLLITTIALVVIAFLLATIISLLIYFRKQKPVNSSQQTVSNGGT